MTPPDRETLMPRTGPGSNPKTRRYIRVVEAHTLNDNHDVRPTGSKPGTRPLLPCGSALLCCMLDRTPTRTRIPAYRRGAPDDGRTDRHKLAPSAGLVLDDVRGMALAEDGRSVHVLDTHFVHQLGLDGRVLASMGGPGKGPGELEAPIEVKPAAGGGAWVYDPPNGRATRYGPESSVEDEISGIDHADAPFVAFGDGILMSVVRKPRVSVIGADGTRGVRNASTRAEVARNGWLPTTRFERDAWT